MTAALFLRAAALSAVLSPASFGAPRDVAGVCAAVARSASPYFVPVTTTNVIVDGDYAYALLQHGSESYNLVLVRNGPRWSAPFALGPHFPEPRSLTSRGVPESTEERILANLQRIYQVPPNARAVACAS